MNILILLPKSLYIRGLLPFFGWVGAEMGRAAVSLSYEEILDFVESNPCVKSWLGKYRLAPRDDAVLSGSRLNKARILCRFFKWLQVVKDVDLSPKELLKKQDQLRRSGDFEDRQWLLRLVLEHSRDNPDFRDYADLRKYDFFVTMKSFCEYHDVVLTVARGVFGRKRKKKNHRKQMTLSDAKRILGKMNQRDRCMCLIMLQSGMSRGTVLNDFNYMWFSQVKPQLDAGRERLRIEFDERKANGTWYFTYVSRDGIQELRKWLVERKRIVENAVADGRKVSREVVEGEPIFITSTALPLRAHRWGEQFSRRWSPKVTTHMFRKLFKSEASVPDRGINRNYIEFFMGRAEAADGLDATGGVYDRTPELYEKTFEKEYEKIEPYINIYSGVQVEPLDEYEGEWKEFFNVFRETFGNNPERLEKFVKFLDTI